MGRAGVTRLGRYWLFFVIVAVGLALSWGQVGQKTHRVLQNAPVVYLQTERDCRPGVAPCTAIGGDRALVLGPAGRGLLARHTGFDASTLVAAEAISLDAEGRELARVNLLPAAREWPLADIPPNTHTLRYRIDANRETTVAEFPLGNL